MTQSECAVVRLQPPAVSDEPPDYSRVVRHMLSQFTDVDDHRRPGRNHWHDESGLYANAHLRPDCPYYKHRPAPYGCRLI